MKTSFIYLCFFLLIGCNDYDIGYLHTQNLSYTPDSLIVKSILNPDDPTDADRIKFEKPYQSNEIEGVTGTFPITYTIKSVFTQQNLVTEDIAQQFSMRGKGVIVIQYNHTIPPGKYSIGIQISNCRKTYQQDSIFTVIVK